MGLSQTRDQTSIEASLGKKIGRSPSILYRTGLLQHWGETGEIKLFLQASEIIKMMKLITVFIYLFYFVCLAMVPKSRTPNYTSEYEKIWCKGTKNPCLIFLSVKAYTITIGWKKLKLFL